MLITYYLRARLISFLKNGYFLLGPIGIVNYLQTVELLAIQSKQFTLSYPHISGLKDVNFAQFCSPCISVIINESVHRYLQRQKFRNIIHPDRFNYSAENFFFVI